MRYTNKKVTIHQIVHTFYDEYERSIINEFSSFMDKLLEKALINDIKEETRVTFRVKELKEEYGSASVYLTQNKDTTQ